jgi:hypothetical protein
MLTYSDACAAPEWLLPPQHNGGKAFVDERTGCWAVPLLVETTWEEVCQRMPTYANVY